MTSSTPSLREPRRGMLAAAALLLGVALATAPASTADAAAQRFLATNVTTTSYALGGEIARCSVSSDGGVCAITSGRNATRTITAEIGATRAEIAASLGISAATTVTLTVGCTSPPMRAGQTWRARAMGTRYVYTVVRQELQRPRVGPSRWVTVRTSPNRAQAFSPSSGQLSCGF
ncbi:MULTISPECIES: hypothetical protein [unclassified Agrococcus]|uniref:hypothetical protein n=1 Tax=unclassified Agrococcus TaxID=2615065 RepID=UPI0036218764